MGRGAHHARVVVMLLSSTLVGAAPTSRPAAKLVFTEIMYDPLSSESDDKQTEWVEIRNVGTDPVNLEGMQLTSGSKQKPHDAKQRFVLGNLELPAGGYVVIGIGTAESYEGLGLPAFAAYAGETHYAWLTNSGDSIAVRDSGGNVIDEVVYETESPWPAIKSSGSSIQFIAPAGVDPAVANDDPAHWVASDSSNSDPFDKHGRGTPGSGPKTSTTKPAVAKSPARGRR